LKVTKVKLIIKKMKIDQFEDILAWQKAKIMTLRIYSLFKNIKDFSFRDQICRASVSIMNNIAEGFERRSDSEFKHFLYVAKGSCGEVRSMLYLASELKYIKVEEYSILLSSSKEISKIISGLIKTLA
jgi:four helix bundle protein